MSKILFVGYTTKHHDCADKILRIPDSDRGADGKLSPENIARRYDQLQTLARKTFLGIPEHFCAVLIDSQKSTFKFVNSEDIDNLTTVDDVAANVALHYTAILQQCQLEDDYLPMTVVGFAPHVFYRQTQLALAEYTISEGRLLNNTGYDFVETRADFDFSYVDLFNSFDGHYRRRQDVMDVQQLQAAIARLGIPLPEADMSYEPYDDALLDLLVSLELYYKLTAWTAPGNMKSVNHKTNVQLGLLKAIHFVRQRLELINTPDTAAAIADKDRLVPVLPLNTPPVPLPNPITTSHIATFSHFDYPEIKLPADTAAILAREQSLDELAHAMAAGPVSQAEPAKPKAKRKKQPKKASKKRKASKSKKKVRTKVKK